MIDFDTLEYEAIKMAEGKKIDHHLYDDEEKFYLLMIAYHKKCLAYYQSVFEDSVRLP